MIKDFLKTIAISLITLSLAGVAYAWTEPVSNPPAGNTKAPVTVSSDTQYKSGLFSTEYLRSYNNALLATDGGSVGIGSAGTPGAKLHITALEAGQIIDFQDPKWGLLFQRSGSNLFGFHADGGVPTLYTHTGKFALMSGNVGIGIDPTYKLDVAGAINATTGLYISGTRKDTVWDGKQDAIAGGASTITASNLTANRALVSDASGKVAVSGTTSTELGYVSGVTSAIQTQLNTKAPTASPTFTGSVTMPGTGIWNSSGYVGVGTVGPVSKLHVYQDSDVWHTRIGGGSGELRIGAQNPYGAIIQAYTPAGAWTFGTRNLLLQPNGGSVAIGTVSPGTDKLYVQGNTYLSGIIRGATYGFGGMYLKVGTYCEQTNPLTNGCTCPVFFTAKTWNNSFRGDGALGYSGFSITHCYR